MKVIEGESKFTIQNFDKGISTAMLKKGEQYFSNGAILDLEENNGNWAAEVEGSEVYTVNISLKNDGDELLKIYLRALEIQGDNAGDRSAYSGLVSLMKKLIKDIPAGKEQITAVAQKLKIKYPRRPALIDELNALLK